MVGLIGTKGGIQAFSRKRWIIPNNHWPGTILLAAKLSAAGPTCIMLSIQVGMF